jgi:SAM-dependent methyltransferase
MLNWARLGFAPTALFQNITCPLCGSDAFDVEFHAKYPSDVDAQQLKNMFHASSDQALLDQVVRCRSCSLVYVNPRIHPDLIRTGYSEAEDPLFAAQNPFRIRAFRKALRSVVRRLKIDPRGKRVLDVGCASGAFLVAAREIGFEAHGIEPSHWMADFGRREYGLHIRGGYLEPGTFPDQSFDVATLWDVIEHLPNPNETLTTIRRLLKPDGVLLVNYPDISSLAARMLGKRWPFWLGVHLLYYTPATMFRQLQRAGFEPRWKQAFWMTLPLGYVLERAAPYVAPLARLAPLSGWLGMNALPLTYNIGQTLVVSRTGRS